SHSLPSEQQNQRQADSRATAKNQQGSLVLQAGGEATLTPEMVWRTIVLGSDDGSTSVGSSSLPAKIAGSVADASATGAELRSSVSRSEHVTGLGAGLDIRRRKLLPPTAWQRAAFAFAIAAFLIFILILSFILWATANRRHTMDGGIGTISEQGCSQTKQLNTGIHLVINIMSTFLLAGSNYYMQCVVAPSRTEVDMVDWIDSAWLNAWTYMETLFNPLGGNLLVVVGDPEESLSDTDIQFHKDGRVFISSSPEIDIPQPFEWMCQREVVDEIQTCEDWLLEFKATPDNWKPFKSVVKECYSQATDEHCKIKFSQLLCWVVVAVNLLKVALMLLIAFGRGESPLLTVGDAVASFLEHTDETTRGMCLKTKQGFYIGDWAERSREFDSTRPRKYDAASFTHWVMYHFLHHKCLRFGSAAISAACHPCEAEENAWEEPLQWGVVAAPADGPGRCSFSSAPVDVPSKVKLYA
ncbi:hypothetical protein CMUS01_06085, partial [Colletotrichum musicola]